MKSQITVFMILGMVIFIAFAFLFFVSHQVAEQPLEKQVNRIFDDFLKATSVKEHIEDCLHEAAKKGIQLVAIQGGRIYDEQIEMPPEKNDLILYFSFNQEEQYNTAPIPAK